MQFKFSYFRKVLVTVIHLRAVQVLFQIRNRIRNRRPLQDYSFKRPTSTPLLFIHVPSPEKILNINSKNYEFVFLNLRKVFVNEVDWNFNEYGKLWNYNLQYADFLKIKGIKEESRAHLILNLYESLWTGVVPLEPYPASLRIMNVIRFIVTEVVRNENRNRLLGYLGSELNYLSKNLEYHLLANHLLENAFTLLMGGYFFDYTPWKKTASVLLKNELNEQILSDGAHFELSPMYHQIILFRVLEAHTYLDESDELKPLLESISVKMLSWLERISFRNGTVPHFNDTTDGVSLTTTQLMALAKKAGINTQKRIGVLSNSGYRKFEFDGFELFFDMHGISPSYQPGHAHADTFSFCLNYNSVPYFVDTGTSTYEISARRDWERSTNAHNTIELAKKNSSEVWAGFRVGRRASVIITEDNKQSVIASHNGYRFLGATVQRSFKIIDNQLIIQDQIDCKEKMDYPIVGRIHLSPELRIQEQEKKIILSDKICIEFDKNVDVTIEEFEMALGFNQRIKSKRISYILQDTHTSLRIYKVA